MLATSWLIVSPLGSMHTSASYLLPWGWEGVNFGKADLAMWLSDQIPLVTSHYSWENKSPDSFHAIPGLSLPFLPQLPHFLITLSIYCSHSAELLTIPWYPKHSWSFGIFPFPLPPSILLFSIKSHFSFNSQCHYQLVRSFHLESVPIRSVLPPQFVDSTGILNHSVGWWFIGTGIDSMCLSSSLESLRSGFRSFSSLCL